MLFGYISAVLNLIINGIPSIQQKPSSHMQGTCVLNLIINGIPSILMSDVDRELWEAEVLNLIINGIPSILRMVICLLVR